MAEGDEARAATAEAARRTTARRDLQRHQHFDDVSPEVGELDEEAFSQLVEDDLDEALTMLADMANATDENLRSLARSLAARVLVDLARAGVTRSRGVGRLRTQRASTVPGDVDIEASLDGIISARAGKRPIDLDELSVRAWSRPDTALCLLVDRSGSMTGDRLAAAALAAATVMFRHGQACSVVAFSQEAIVVKAQDEHRDADAVVGDLLSLRGHGVTDLGLALRTAQHQLERSRASRRVTILLSDARSTSGGDPHLDAAVVAALGELSIIAPEGDTADAQSLAESVGGRCIELGGPSTIPTALRQALLED